MDALIHLALAETALLQTIQTTATWVAIEEIRRARAEVLWLAPPPIPVLQRGWSDHEWGD